MIHSIKNYGLHKLGLFLLLALMVVSCNTEDEATITEIENLSDESIADIQSKVIGKKYCVEFVFPLSIMFVDSTTVEVTDYTNLHETIVTFFTDNDIEITRENKPSLVFPVEVITEDAEVVQVNSQEELKELKSECRKEGICKDDKKGKGHVCFELEFPVSIIIDDVSTEFLDRQSLKEAIRDYKETVGEDAKRPELEFPISIIYEDETTLEVTSKEMLKELKEACRDEE